MAKRAIAMFSGGLDSSLAVAVIKNQGIEVTAFHLVSDFCRTTDAGEVHPDIVAAATELGVELHTENSTEAMMDMVRSPGHGFGKNMNPCIDCRIYTIMRAERYRQQVGADFLITGEVLGQRPMSQNRASMEVIEKETGLVDILLRPLCARVLEPTLPEREGWVDREALPLITGRSRTEQMALAKKYGLSKFGAPAGGCLLTDANYSRKLKDVMAHQDDFDRNDIKLMSVGRHYRLDDKARIVTGRDHEENLRLEDLAREDDRLFQTVQAPGSVALLRCDSVGGEEYWPIAAGLAVHYSRNREKGTADVRVRVAGEHWDSGEVLERIASVDPVSLVNIVDPV